MEAGAMVTHYRGHTDFAEYMALHPFNGDAAIGSYAFRIAILSPWSDTWCVSGLGHCQRVVIWFRQIGKGTEQEAIEWLLEE